MPHKNGLTTWLLFFFQNGKNLGRSDDANGEDSLRTPARDLVCSIVCSSILSSMYPASWSLFFLRSLGRRVQEKSPLQVPWPWVAYEQPHSLGEPARRLRPWVEQCTALFNLLETDLKPHAACPMIRLLTLT